VSTFEGDVARQAPVEAAGGETPAESVASGSDSRAAEFAVFALKDADRDINLVWFRSGVEARIPGVEITTVDETCSEETLPALTEKAGEALTVLIAIFDDVVAWKGRAGPSPELIAIARRVIEAAERVIVVAFTGPELAMSLPGKASFVCCYDASPHSQCAAVECIFGENPITGRLPVALPPLYGVGWGLKR
jgi:hypothetical protein